MHNIKNPQTLVQEQIKHENVKKKLNLTTL